MHWTCLSMSSFIPYGDLDDNDGSVVEVDCSKVIDSDGIFSDAVSLWKYPLCWGKLSIQIPTTPNLHPAVVDFSVLVFFMSVFSNTFLNVIFSGPMEKLLMTFS